MLFNSIVYGPIHSRRLGTSLGINLMPTDAKICTFNCVYCECGWNRPVIHPMLPTRAAVKAALEAKLREIVNCPMAIGKPLDVITFSGNGEPTLHPEFEGIIYDTIALRDHYCPNAKISVLSNSTQLGRMDVVRGLQLCDYRILKLDSGIDRTMRLIDQPTNSALTVKQIEGYLKFFEGDFTLQTCFLRGVYQNEVIDNTTPEEVGAWYRIIDELHPKQIMMYCIDRQTPCPMLQKISRDEMERIAQPLREKGIDLIVC